MSGEAVAAQRLESVACLFALQKVGELRSLHNKLSLSCNSNPCMFSAVPIKLEEIVEETRQLPTDVVAELVDRILLERHGGITPDIETSWKNEIDRRIEEIETGKVEGISVDQSLARIRKIAGL